MGIDYRASFGIGYQVTVRNENGTELNILKAVEKLEYLLENTPYMSFITGDSYTDEIDELFVVLKEPFENSYNATVSMEELGDFLGDNNVDIISGGLVGGLHIY